MEPSQRRKKFLLYSLIGSVVIGAVLGILIVLRNEWGWFEVRVILTTITVAAASLCGLACDLSRTPRGANLLPRIGLGMTLLSATLILIGMWGDVDTEAYWKTTVCSSILAVATVHVCLLSIAQLTGGYRWVLLITYQVVYGLAALLCTMLIFEIEEEGMFRIVATVSIVAAALTLVIPLLHRLSHADKRDKSMATLLEQRNLAAIDREIESLEQRLAQLRDLRNEIATT